MSKCKTIQKDKGSALHTVLFIIVLISLMLMIFIGHFVHQHRYIRSGLEAIQTHYHAESGIVEWLASENSGLQTLLPGGIETLLPLSCGDSVVIRYDNWGVFQRIYSREAGQLTGIRATVGYANADEFSTGLMVEPFPQSLIVCEDTRLYSNVRCGPHNVRAQRLQDIPYSGERPVYGQVYTSRIDQRPRVLHSKVKAILQHQTNLKNLKRLSLSDIVTERTNKIRLTQSRGIYEADFFTHSDSTLTILGPGKLLITDASFFQRNLSIRDEVEILILVESRIGSNIDLKDVVLFSNAPLHFQSIRAEQLQVISSHEVTLKGNSILTDNSIILSVPEENGIGISIGGQTTIDGSICLINDGTKPEDWLSIIRISEGVELTGLLYSDWLLNLSGEITGSCVTSRFYFYQSPTHYFNWIRNATIRQNDNVPLAIPLIFEISSIGKSVIYRESL